MSFALLLTIHGLAATVWTGGHLVLALGVLPGALRQGSAAAIRSFEERFEPLGLTALALQVATGLALAWIYRPGLGAVLQLADPLARLLALKLGLLLATLVLALDARLRLIPRLDDHNLGGLAWHIAAITALAVAFVAVGVAIRLGG
ncbi:CopD family protein [Vulcanococcus limneticus]|uniref:CopD family protein n=1 Tax=Vulcanococcus limneticus TaxID=2170428 RepID=UPI000B98F4FD|nr:CopD family protein [Vulcanococcus limneticus]MCP9793219.1 CopD family protein [Vulcanococcus limneticus MW73D5]MCP9895160.1 CopD family protein [Vulcanococcus limneticus Candia 3F8]MCP9898617.1 CopD family protein [Vulcanococcus limneticus Candia 3B3]